MVQTVSESLFWYCAAIEIELRGHMHEKSKQDEKKTHTTNYQ